MVYSWLFLSNNSLRLFLLLLIDNVFSQILLMFITRCYLQVLGQIDLHFIGTIFSTAVGLSISFPFCYLSTNMFESLRSTNQSIYNCLWYNLSIKHQLYFKLLLVPSCHFRDLSAYGFITCSLETFKKVFLNSSSTQHPKVQ